MIVRVIVSFIVALLISSGIFAEEDLPKGEEVLNKYIAATGGQKAYDKIKNRVTKSTIDMKGQGMKIALTVYAAKPNFTYTVTEIPGMGKMESGVSGDVVWDNSLMTGPVVKEGEERSQGFALAAFDRMAYWKEAYKAAKCVGMETVNDKPCYKVALTLKDFEKKEEKDKKSVHTAFFDKESGLLVRFDMEAKTAMGAMSMQSFMSDYKETDGILIARKVVIKMMGMERIATVDSVEQNVEMPEDRFKLPEEVQALVDKRKKEVAE